MPSSVMRSRPNDSAAAARGLGGDLAPRVQPARRGSDRWAARSRDRAHGSPSARRRRRARLPPEPRRPRRRRQGCEPRPSAPRSFEAPGRSRQGSGRRRPHGPAPQADSGRSRRACHADRPADRLHEPGDPAGRGPDGVGVDLLAERRRRRRAPRRPRRAGGGAPLAGLGLEAVRVEERPDAPAEIAGRRGSVANRDRKNLGLDGKGVGARYRNLHGTGDANSATASKTLSSA